MTVRLQVSAALKPVLPRARQVDNRTAWTSKNYHWNTRDGGFVGWGQRPWAVAAQLATQDGPAVRLTYTSKDGDMVRRAAQLLGCVALRALGL